MLMTTIAFPRRDRTPTITSLKECLDRARALADDLGDTLLVGLLYRAATRVETLSDERLQLEFAARSAPEH